jgi:hypothetical protein
MLLCNFLYEMQEALYYTMSRVDLLDSGSNDLDPTI